jgi:hypothetical protein
MFLTHSLPHYFLLILYHRRFTQHHDDHPVQRSHQPRTRTLRQQIKVKLRTPSRPQYIHVILRENKTKFDHPYYKVTVEKYAFRSIVRAKHALLHYFDDVPGTKLTRVTPNPKIRRAEWEFSFSVTKDGVYDGEIWMERLELFEEISGWYD